MKPHLLFLILLGTSIISPTLASGKPNFGEVGIAGNGCPEEADAIRSSLIKFGADSVHIIPTQFTLSNQFSTKKLIRKKCDLALAVEVPNGYQVGMSNASSQSFLMLDDGSESTVRVEAGFTGNKFEIEELKAEGLVHQSIDLSNKTTQWAECGEDAIIRMKVSATLKADETQFSFVRINSFGLGIEYRACSK